MRIVVLVAAVLLLAGCSESVSGQAQRSPEPSATSTTPPKPTTNSTVTSTVAPAPPPKGAPMSAVVAWVEAGTPAEPADFHSAERDGDSTQLGSDIAFVTAAGTQCMTGMTDATAAGALACLVQLGDPPERPADSYGEWKGGWVDFDGTTAQVGSAHADPGRFAKGTGALLGEGSSLRFGDYQCRDDAAGLLCVNYAHQSGVRLAETGVEPFGCLTPVDKPDAGLTFRC